MCSVKETEQIVHHEAQVLIKEVTLSPLAKLLFGVLLSGMTLTIGFIAERVYTMQGLISDSNDLLKREITLLIKNNSDNIDLLDKWKGVHNERTTAVIKEYDMRVNNNKESIYNIVNTKTDDRWRQSDEVRDNKNKELIHLALDKEDINLRRTINEKCNLTNIRLENIEDDYDEFKDDYYEFHAEMIQHMKARNQ